MNTKILSWALMPLMSVPIACTQNEDVPNEPFQGGTTISLKVGMPGDIRSRAGETPSLSIGSDGLWLFSRTIDKLWYAVYRNGSLVYSSNQPGITQATYNEDESNFQLDIQLAKIDGEVNLSEYSVFFFAGNASDPVTYSSSTTGIGLDFANQKLYAAPTVINTATASGDIYNPAQTDYFAKYVPLADICTGYEGNVVLTRPFAQISLLTDELCQPSLLQSFSSDSKVTLTSKPSIAQVSGSEEDENLSDFALPNVWNYATNSLETISKADLNFSLLANALDNTAGDKTLPNEVTFDSRKMFCLASYLVLAPTSGGVSPTGKLHFEVDVNGNVSNNTINTSVNIPDAGLWANHKYIIYNKAYDPETGEGGGGLFSDHYLMDIQVDPVWTSSENKTI